jgi:hypothetical protein
MGSAALGQCFDSPVQAGEYFSAASFPIVQSGIVYSIQEVQDFGQPYSVLISFTAQNLDISGLGGGYQRVVDFLPCDVATFTQQSAVSITPFNPVDAAAFWSFGMTLVVGVWLLAHNAGAIWRFIVGRKL